MPDETYIRMTTAVQADVYYHLEQTAVGLRTLMDEAHHNREYGQQAVLGDMLTHTLKALSALPGKTDDLPF